MKRWLIYGVTGYSGELIAREACKRGLQPILAARSPGPLISLATELNLDYRCFDLDDVEQVAAQLDGVDVVVNCAGPFSATAATMLQACLAARVHYLDITGEIDVFEHVRSFHGLAVRAGIVLCPGVGFDVVPSDCLALALKQAMPDATELSLAFETYSPPSPGTAKTIVENLAQRSHARINGHIVRVPQAWSVRHIDFGSGPKLAMSLSWGDVSTAFASTGIPNITVYIPAPRWLVVAKNGQSHALGAGNARGSSHPQELDHAAHRRTQRFGAQHQARLGLG